MNIEVYSYSGIGGRPINEDSLFCGQDRFIVSDGLGGHDNGEVASSAAIAHISSNYCSDISENAVGQLLLGADDAVRRTGEGGKATVAALFTDGDKIRISNIGDSRVYYFRRGSVFFRTKDHSVCQASVDMGEMTDNDVRESEDRSGLFKVLGDTQPLKLPKGYDLIDPLDNDAFLICSDGFWEYVYEMEMEADLLKSASAEQWLKHMLKRLLLRSENKGDNFTAICGMIHAPEKASAPLPATMSAAEIPRTCELEASGSSKRSLKIIPVICCAAAAAAAAVMLIIIMGGKENVSDKNDQQSGFETSVPFELTVQTKAPDESGIMGETEDPDETNTPEDAETAEKTEDPEETGTIEGFKPPEETRTMEDFEPPEGTGTMEDFEPPEGTETEI